jgi:hypothetical protein
MQTLHMAITPQNPHLKNLEWLTKLMDSQFSIPGTKIRFGLDPIIGLIPGVGDFVSFIISAYMVSILAKNGASGYVLARMTLNIILDGLVGAIPLAGDLFDFGFKANEKNMQLMREHYLEGRHGGSALKVIIPLLLFLIMIIALIGWLSYQLISWLAHTL